MESNKEICWNSRPFIPAETALYGGMHTGFELHIVRLGTGDGTLELEWLPFRGAYQYKVTVARRGESVGFANNRPEGLPEPVLLPYGQTEYRFSGLANGIDYEVTVFALDKQGRQAARSLSRLFCTGGTDGIVINYIHPDDYSFAFSGRAVANPSILDLPSGRLLVSHQVVWDQGENNLTVMFFSDDQGRTWHYGADFCPCCNGILFRNRGKVVLAGQIRENGAYILGYSEDQGDTWSDPVRCQNIPDADWDQAEEVRIDGRPWQVRVSAQWGAWNNQTANAVIFAERKEG